MFPGIGVLDVITVIAIIGMGLDSFCSEPNY